MMLDKYLDSFYSIIMKTKDHLMNKNKPLELLRDGYKQQFAEFVFESEGFTDLLMELSYEFTNDQLDVIQDEDVRLELAMMLTDSIKMGTY